MKKIALFGSTGSIGRSTLNVINSLPLDFCVHSLAIHSNIELLEKQIKKFHPKKICVFDAQKAQEFNRKNKGTIYSGKEGLIALAKDPEVDMVVMAMSGIEGIAPTIAAIEEKKPIALASKEIIVSCGSYLMQKAQENKVAIIPVDSEHNAIFQCLHGENIQNVQKIILTASGGSFLHSSQKELESISVQDALQHPTYQMGKKITIDSSTLMNKGLEVIEAQELFNVPLDKIEVVIHPQSIIHGMVVFRDGSIIAQMNRPNMEVPILHALSYPERKKGYFSSLNFAELGQMTFQAVDYTRFPCLDLAYEAARRGKSYPCYLNSANEVLVHRFLQGEILWKEIYIKLEQLISSHDPIDMIDLSSIFSIIEKAKQEATVI